MNLPLYKPKGTETSSPIPRIPPGRIPVDRSGQINYCRRIETLNGQGAAMATHAHRFIETFDGFVGFGLNRETDKDTVIYYLQKFSDDQLMALLRDRLTDADRQAIFDLLSALLHRHLSEPEYHRYFLKDDH
jgi:hypothetical protein